MLWFNWMHGGEGGRKKGEKEHLVRVCIYSVAEGGWQLGGVWLIRSKLWKKLSYSVNPFIERRRRRRQKTSKKKKITGWVINSATLHLFRHEQQALWVMNEFLLLYRTLRRSHKVCSPFSHYHGEAIKSMDAFDVIIFPLPIAHSKKKNLFYWWREKNGRLLNAHRWNKSRSVWIRFGWGLDHRFLFPYFRMFVSFYTTTKKKKIGYTQTIRHRRAAGRREKSKRTKES